MDSNLLKYMAFIRTVECGSFTKAAEQLNYSQSGISRMINDLETEWHVKLLERSRAGVRLTSDGLTLLPYAKSVCEDYRRLQMQIDDLKGLQYRNNSHRDHSKRCGALAAAYNQPFQAGLPEYRLRAAYRRLRRDESSG